VEDVTDDDRLLAPGNSVRLPARVSHPNLRYTQERVVIHRERYMCFYILSKSSTASAENTS
jgi:hypothetical protein